MNFYSLCHQYLNNLAKQIEDADNSCLCEVDYADGILNITISATQQTFVINRNAGNEKIWYSSPISGPDYFSFNKNQNAWLNQQNLNLTDKIFSELNICKI
jgi:frataxin-like iron-binding protein CyaY